MIVWLSMCENDVWGGYSKFRELSRIQGEDIRCVTANSTGSSSSTGLDALDDADSYILSFWDLLNAISSINEFGLSENEYLESLVDGVQLATRLLILMGSDAHGREHFNVLLDYFDLTVATHEILNHNFEHALEDAPHYGSAAAEVDERKVSVGSLLRDVDRVALMYPSQIMYLDRNQPLLVAEYAEAGGRRMIRRDDGLAEIQEGREAAVAASWTRGYGEAPALVAISGGAFTNPLLEENKKFALNLLAWLGESEWVSAEASAAYKEWRAIEKALFGLVKGVLEEAFGEDWFGMIPEGVRASVMSQRRSKSFPTPEHFLGLPDLRLIIAARWHLFAHHFDSHANQNPNKVLKWFDRVLGIRTRSAHPTRAEAQPITREEVEFLAGRRAEIVSVVKRYRATRMNPDA